MAAEQEEPRRPERREPSIDAAPEETASSGAAFRATVSLNDILVGVVENLAFAQRLDHLPFRLRSALDYLALEVAKLQGVTEWIAEELVVLAPEADVDEKYPAGEE